MAGTHPENVLNRQTKSELVRLLFNNTEANMVVQISTVTAEVKKLNKYLKKNECGCCDSGKCKLRSS